LRRNVLDRLAPLGAAVSVSESSAMTSLIVILLTAFAVGAIAGDLAGGRGGGAESGGGGGALRGRPQHRAVRRQLVLDTLDRSFGHLLRTLFLELRQTCEL